MGACLLFQLQRFYVVVVTSCVLVATLAQSWAQGTASVNKGSLDSTLTLAAPYQAPAGRSQCQGVDGYYSSPSGTRNFLLRPEWLTAEKTKILRDPVYGVPLLKAAEEALKRGPYSVADKLKTPQSGDRHDYFSVGPYWWPTSGKPNGEPYVRRDGEVNPESRGLELNKDRITKFNKDVRILGLSYHYFGNQRYADHAAKLIRAWFLNADTRMNPNLNFGQAVPSVTAGRGEGLIEMTALTNVIETVGLIEKSGALSKAELGAVEDWYRQFVTWMASSRIGRDEMAKSNNHGIHYDYLISHMALFARMESVASAVVSGFPATRIAVQLAPDGSLPEELARTGSWHYSFFVLQGATKLATIGECVGYDLWKSSTPDGRNLAKAFEFLAPYQSNMVAWKYDDKDMTDAAKNDHLRRGAVEQYRLMAWGSNNANYELIAANHSVKSDPANDYWLPPFTAAAQ